MGWPMLRQSFAVAAVAGVIACGSPASPSPDAGTDLGSDAGRADTGATDAASAADTGCTTDGDGDGHRSVACGGDDCDDADPNRYPGHSEICDTRDHDEDCDPVTYGFRDSDADAHPDARCCNVDAAGIRACGDDCDDMRPDIHPGLAEVCDRVDNDCDRMVDNGVLRTFTIDADGDGFGSSDPAAMTMTGCMPPIGYVENSTDCEDGVAGRNPGAPEVCDGIDSDCDTLVDEALTIGTCYPDGDGDGFTGSGTMMTCGACPGPEWVGAPTLLTDCDDLASGVFPGETSFHAAATAAGSFDYDCSGAYEHDPSQQPCADRTSPGPCDTLFGFSSSAWPGTCGNSGTTVYCSWNTFFGRCVETPAGGTRTEVRRCR